MVDRSPLAQGNEKRILDPCPTRPCCAPHIHLKNHQRSTRGWHITAIKNSQGIASFNRLVGESKAMANLRARISRYAQTEATVLILGETGTGKSLIARSLHDLSSRRKGPFIAVNCAAIPGSLAESELFGSTKGAYTGAIGYRSGLIARASGGTLFLDEFGELGAEVQSKFLRTLESGLYRPLGSNQEQRANIRIIAATNRDLERSVLQGEFRADLYYRINVLQILAPALRNRQCDIPLIVAAILGDLLPEEASIRVTDSVMSELVQARWLGNIRELKNLLRRSLAMCDGDVLEHLEHPIRHDPPNLPDFNSQSNGLRPLIDALIRNHGQLAAVADEIGVSVRTIQRRMKRSGLRLKDFRRP